MSYEGERNGQGQRHGKGTYTYASGNVYEGEYKEDKRDSQGTYTYPKGESYVGEWKEDKKHGQGTFTDADGRSYDGEYKEGNMHGQGTYTWSDGNVYKGEYKEGKKHGQGTFTWVDGESYKGEFKEDKYHGQGTYTYARGAAYKGEYKEDKKHGPGTFTRADGATLRVLAELEKFTNADGERVDATHENFQRALDKQQEHQPQPQQQRNTPEFSVDYSFKLGAGGQGTVYKGFDNVTKKPVAVKVQPGGDLGPEFKLLATLKHQNIVEALHFDDGAADAGLPIPKIFLEFVEGGSLDKCISPAAPLPEEEIRRHLSSVLQGLAYCHAQVPPVCHRDIKPANMLLTKDGTIKLTDFGSGKGQGKTGQTTTATAGTWVYMAPEACQGKPCAASDLWSLACSVGEMASGKKPWHETGLKDFPLGTHISMPDPPLNHYPTVPQSLSVPLQSMLRKMFAHNPEDRGTAASHLKDPYFTNEIPAPTAGGGSAGASAFPQWLLAIPIPDDVRATLVKNRIDETSLELLDGDDLKELGVAFGPRKVLLNEIAKRKAK